MKNVIKGIACASAVMLTGTLSAQAFAADAFDEKPLKRNAKQSL